MSYTKIIKILTFYVYYIDINLIAVVVVAIADYQRYKKEQDSAPKLIKTN